MSGELETAIAEVATLAAAARRALARGDVPDLAPVARGVERVAGLVEAAEPRDLAGLRLRFVALTHELGELAEAASTALARTRTALAATERHRTAAAAYGGGSGGR